MQRHANKPRLMGILNVTPDSFSDGGRYLAREQAIAHGLALGAAGADIIDVGGESTRPGAQEVAPAEQMRRVVDVIVALREALPGAISISIDTSSAAVAAAALAAGATMINDVSAARRDPRMLALAASTGASLVLMHMQGSPQTMQSDPHYDDVVAEVELFLSERVSCARRAGVRAEQIILDPGIGFGKTVEHNLCLMAGLPRLVGLGYPVLLGASRKRFLGAVTGAGKPACLTAATCATTALGVWAGVSMFRVHDVVENRQAVDVAWAVRSSNEVGDDS